MVNKQVCEMLVPEFECDQRDSISVKGMTNLVLNVISANLSKVNYGLDLEMKKPLAVIARVMKHHEILGSKYVKQTSL
jgi:hypothetical protein